MKKLFLAMAFLAASFSASATTVTFDQDGLDLSNIDGVSFSSFGIIQPTKDETGYFNGVVSPSKVAFNPDAIPVTVFSQTSAGFFFNSASFVAAWNDGLTLDIHGYTLGGDEYFKSLTLSTTSPTFVEFNWSNVSHISFTSYGGTPAGYAGWGDHFGMDNFTFNVPVSAVPELTPVTMLTAGLLLVGMTRRRKSKG